MKRGGELNGMGTLSFRLILSPKNEGRIW